MSWSFTALGKPRAVADKFKADAVRNGCPEPEESIKQKVVDIVEAALSAFPTNVAVKVVANGHQHVPGEREDGIVNTLSLSIEPLYGFVEE